MARTSKRYANKKEIQEHKVFYKAGIYARLSSERKEEWRTKSSSIETQILCCKEYALKENIKIVHSYIDYEYSGSNFERPQFQEMMQDIRDRKINCIIIRDLSRLGREYLEMGRLIDKVFPFLGVRFISVNDKLDTVKNEDSKKSFEVTLKNIVNDMYAKDISVKIKTCKHNKARNGYFIGSVPPFGYKVVKLKEGQKLAIDENVRFIVEEMFRLSLEDKSEYEIAKHFNRQGYATGMVYYKTGRVYRQDGDPQWTKATIANMLVNPSYTGTLVQGVKQQNLAKGVKQHYVDKDQQIVYENAHEPIISKEDFEKVLEGRKERLKSHPFGATPRDFKRDPENRYKGLVFNHATGKELYRRTRIYGKNHDRLYYSFQNDTCTGRLDNEKKVFIMERDLDKAISDKVSECIKKATSKSKLTQRVSTRFDESINAISNEICKLKDKREKEQLLIQKAYEEYSLGKLDKDTYLLKREIAISHIATIDTEIIAVDNEIKNLEKEKKKSLSWINDLFKSKNIEKLSSDLIHSLVEKVIVYGRHEFEVVLKFDIETLIGGALNE